MTQKAQIQALQADHEEVYFTEETDSEDDLAALDQELQLLMHAVWGVKAKRHFHISHPNGTATCHSIEVIAPLVQNLVTNVQFHTKALKS
jgi:hypothetical protein